jgi:hypothetical protein
MSFLNFRQARRKAKKIVSLRYPRPATPPTPDSFVSTNVVEIGDPSRPAAEACYAPLTLQLDLGVKGEPFLHSDHILSPSRERALTTSSRQTRDRLSRPRSKSDVVGSVQPRVSGPASKLSIVSAYTEDGFQDDRLAEVEDITRVCLSYQHSTPFPRPPANYLPDDILGYGFPPCHQRSTRADQDSAHDSCIKGTDSAIGRNVCGIAPYFYEPPGVSRR